MKAFSLCLCVAAAPIALTGRVGAQHGGVVHTKVVYYTVKAIRP